MVGSGDLGLGWAVQGRTGHQNGETVCLYFWIPKECMYVCIDGMDGPRDGRIRLLAGWLAGLAITGNLGIWEYAGIYLVYIPCLLIWNGMTWLA